MPSGDSIVGTLSVMGMLTSVSGNRGVNCRVEMTSSSDVFAGNVYGGAISVYVGHYSLDRLSSTVSGCSAVSRSSFMISSNAFTSCIASSVALGRLGSGGANSYGGGVSLNVGAYSYSLGSSSVTR